jgi:hypothetical protein
MDGENKIKKIKNTLVLTPHAFEKWINGKTPFIKILQSGSFKLKLVSENSIYGKI